MESFHTSRDLDLFKPLFDCAPADTIKRALTVATQYALGRVSDTICQHWKSCFYPCNVKRRNEVAAADIIFSDTLADNCGCEAAQLFVGWTSLAADVHGIKTNKEFVPILEDNIHDLEAMEKLLRDCTRAETGTCIKDILRATITSDWQSEP
jgi:hypothetical protein